MNAIFGRNGDSAHSNKEKSIQYVDDYKSTFTKTSLNMDDYFRLKMVQRGQVLQTPGLAEIKQHNPISSVNTTQDVLKGKTNKRKRKESSLHKNKRRRVSKNKFRED